MKKADLIFTLFRIPVDFLMLVCAGIAAYILRLSPLLRGIRPVLFEVNLPLSRYIPLVGVIAISWILVFSIVGVYRVRRRSFFDEWISIVVATAVGVLAVIVYLFLSLTRFDSRFIILSAWPLSIIFVTFGRIVLRIAQGYLVSRFHFGVHRALVIGDDPLAKEIISLISSQPSLGYRIVKHIPQLDIGLVKQAIRNPQVDEIILSSFDWPKERIIELIALSTEFQLTFKFAPNIFETLTAHTSLEAIGGIPVVGLRRTSLEGWGKIIKRGLDIIGALSLLILFAPFFVLLAVLVKLDSPGPVVYKNRRVGPKGRDFTAYKLRTMKIEYCTGPEYETGDAASRFEDTLIREQSIRKGPVFKILDDPRRTRMGKFLERTSLDELPQFVNVLLGNMSLVGPRPHMPKEVKNYERHHRTVFNVKPGITGLAQISGRSDLDFEDEVKLDTYYIENWSLWLDFIILLKTPFVILFRKHKR